MSQFPMRYTSRTSMRKPGPIRILVILHLSLPNFIHWNVIRLIHILIILNLPNPIHSIRSPLILTLPHLILLPLILHLRLRIPIPIYFPIYAPDPLQT